MLIDTVLGLKSFRALIHYSANELTLKKNNGQVHSQCTVLSGGFGDAEGKESCGTLKTKTIKKLEGFLVLSYDC